MNLKDLLLQEYKTFAPSASKSIESSVREESIKQLGEMGIPSMKMEEWKYTNLKSILETPFTTNTTSEISKDAIHYYNIDAYRLVFVNGILNTNLSDTKGLEDFATLTSIADADAAVVKKYINTFNPFHDGLLASNLAFATNGVFLNVKKGKTVPKPIVAYFISDTTKGPVLVQPRNLIVLEQASSVKWIESFQSIGNDISFTNICSEFFLHLDANLEQYKFQQENDKAYHVGNSQVVHLEKSTSFAGTYTWSGALVRNNLNIHLGAEYCEAHLYGLYLGNGSQHIDNHSLVDHAKANCYSNELYKGILNGESKGVFNGKIWVQKDAQKTNAFQSNKTVLLSQKATMNTKPQLEIFADDVKCSHGATVGQMDESALFFLRARGIPEAQAKVLLMQAFSDDVLNKISIPALQEEISAIIAQGLISQK
jgi:Fe-S cluster assembly protein SufD